MILIVIFASARPINYIAVMNNPRTFLDKPVVPITLSAQKARQPEHTPYTPYKIEWSNASPQAPSTKVSNKTFFNSMKMELSSLKNDVEKMLHKKSEAGGSSEKPRGRIPMAEILNSSQNKKVINLVAKDRDPSSFDVGKPSDTSSAAKRSKPEETTKKLQNELKIQKSLIHELKSENARIYNELQAKTQMIVDLQKALLQSEDTIRSHERAESEATQKWHSANQEVQKLKDVNEELRRHNSYLEQCIEDFNGKLNNLQIEITAKEQQEEEFHQRYNQILEELESTKNQLTKEKQLRAEDQSEMEGKDQINALDNLNNSERLEDLMKTNSQLESEIKHLQNQLNRQQTERQSLNRKVHILVEERREKERQLRSMEVRQDRRGKDKLVEQYEFRIMKLQNTIDSLRDSRPSKHSHDYIDQTSIQSCESLKESVCETQINFNRILKSQLEENECLKNKLREMSCEVLGLKRDIKELEQERNLWREEAAQQEMKVSVLKKKMDSHTVEEDSEGEIQSLKFSIDILKKKQESLSIMLQSKNKQIKSKDEFIQKILISKTGKSEEADEVDYLMTKLREWVALTTDEKLQ